jgi:LPS sulfotransferase NodH
MALASETADLPAPAQPEHVFIVGLPRTGSTLLRGILNASGEVWVAGESHFFDRPTHLGLGHAPGYRKRLGADRQLSADQQLEQVVDAIWSLRGKSYWARLARSTDRDAFLADLRASGRTERDLFDLSLAHFARGRRIRGEKTPHHIYAVPTLLAWFPDARIIHTFRDPRAVYLSLRRKEAPGRLSLAGRTARRLGAVFDLYATINFARSWRRMAALHRMYASRFADRYRMIRFEDLVREPMTTVQDLCEFLAIPYRSEMLDQVVHNSSFMAKGGAGGIDRDVVDRWRRELDPVTARWIARLCGPDLQAFGYADQGQ